MEKRKPHFDLGTIQATFCEVGALRITRTALRCARDLGLSLDDVVACIQSIGPRHFYKSMTSHASAAIWQDVYHVPYRSLVLYVKFTTDIEGYLVISFKER